MRLKSFYAANSTEAMRLVREALGEDAIIVSTRDDERGGVRVTAAIDDPVVSSPAPQPRTTGSMPDANPDNDTLDLIAQSFLRHQVPNALAERLLATATQYASEDSLLAVGASFDTHFIFQPLSEDIPSVPLILIGPPGAGKTLCAAKLATKAALAKRPVTLISTDTERAGGMAQLRAFANLLQTDILEIEDPHALEDALHIQPAGQVTIIDTAGCNPLDPSQRDALAFLVKASKATPILVMPADMDAATATDMAGVFHGMGAAALLATRLDMTRRLGGMLSVAYSSKIPLCNFSASGKVSEPPQPLNPVSLARLILPLPATPAQQATGTE
ncbi:MAG: GTPase [Alphaproteobacteria bacterium]|nr:GTPase [Alphaproteobacteria bacterium]